jgi:hypothetical protein
MQFPTPQKGKESGAKSFSQPQENIVVPGVGK